jgi:hypothetical protein
MKTLSTFYQFIGIGLVAGMLTSCAPTVTTYQLAPVSGDIATIDGRAVTKAERNGVGVVASFEREDMEFVTLDIEIKNRTNDTIEVNPADFHFAALGAYQDTLTDPGNAGLSLTRTAADPTYEAGRIGLKRKQEEKRLKRAKVFNTVLMVALIASDVSSSGKSRSYGEYVNNRITHNLAYQGLAAKRVIDYSTFANRMQRYDYEEYRWRELALKANTLAPGESVRGFVYLPKVANANYLAINYSVAEQATVPLLFKQELVQQKKNRKRR